MMPTITSFTEEQLHRKQEKEDPKSPISTAQDASSHNLNVTGLLEMVTEPLSTYCQKTAADSLSASSATPTTTHTASNAMPVPPPKLGFSRSADEDYNEEQFEHNFGSISPIFYNGRSSISAVGAARAQNFRSKFRKSHTCGSLFANCNCSSANTLTAPIPIQAHQQMSYQSQQSQHYQQPQQRNSSERLATFHLSISPSSPNNDISFSPTTSSSVRRSSGVYTLSTQTSAATSAQLSHDESMSTSFDYVAGIVGVGAGAGAGFSSGFGDVSATGASASTGASAAIGERTRSDHSLCAARQVSSTETEAHSVVVETLQVPSIGSPTKLDRGTSPLPTRRVERDPNRKPKRLFQSYSHPDTTFIFTDENKHPSKESPSVAHSQAEPAITCRDGKVEITQPAKRSSSPNIAHFQVLDVAVHPDIVVKISPRQSPSTESNRRATTSSSSGRSAQQRRRLLQRSHEIGSYGSTSESDYSLEVKPSATLKHSTQPSTTELGATLASPTRRQRSFPAPETGQAKVEDDASFNAAQKYFAESGILGPINTSSNFIRKTSKILQDSNIIEQIRKTSMILRANSSAAHQTLTSKSPTSPATTLPSTETANVPPRTQHASMEVSAVGSIRGPSTESGGPPAVAQSRATTCGLSSTGHSHSRTDPDERDAQMQNLYGEIDSLKEVLKSRDAELMRLRREVHKLKSVLQQTTNHLTLPRDDLLQTPPSTLAKRNCPTRTTATPPPPPPQCTEVSSTEATSVSALPAATCQCCKQQLTTQASHSSRRSLDSSGSLDSNENYQPCLSQPTFATTNAVTCALAPADNADSSDSRTSSTGIDCDSSLVSKRLSSPMDGMDKTKLLQVSHVAPVLKKQGVSGESSETSMQQSINIPIPKYDKDYRSKQLIKDAIMDNDFLKNIDASQVRELVESMYPLSVAKGEFVIREGDVGAHLYVSATGEFEVVKNGKVLGIMGAGKAFGELAILYNCTRTASVRVLSEASVWVLDRRVFQQIMMRTGMQRIENSVNFLRSVPLLKNLSEELLAKIADVLEVEFYPAGTYIIRQGASGDTFFLISQGSVKVTQKLGHSGEEKEIRVLERGDYFGEQALINEDKRTANIIALSPGVECLTLDRESFTHLIGDLCELKEKNYGDENRVLAMKFAASKSHVIFGADAQQEFPSMKLTDLEVVTTLGIGGFGRVELVKAYQENRVDTFALKCLKKRHIVDTKQEEHVFSERTIMLSCKSPFICRLYRTFRDEKYVYMLLEACMGGEIWTMLRDRGSFDENATQFIVGCVLQAFEYLHSRGIIYRDLKPENLMLDERGYVKLVDFGFAKYIGNSQKTWTFCGTPEYVAPEIILNKGHDRAVDYWALGILIHELLNGTPPFTANDPMKTYNIILKGIDHIEFPKHMSRSAVLLIKKLCRDVPAERLGYQKGGIQDIKKHKWFLGFDWDGLEEQLLIPPFIRPISHPTDTSYFDKFPCDTSEPPDEFSGWDEGF